MTSEDERRRRVRAARAHAATYADPITVAQGEQVAVHREDDEFPGWFWCRAADGREGWVPGHLLGSHEGGRAIATASYTARELSIAPGEDLLAGPPVGGWCVVTNERGESGWVPCASLTES